MPKTGARCVNLAENLDRTARARGRFEALDLGGEVSTFTEVDGWSRRVAGFLWDDGVRAGDRVGLLLADVLGFAALYYGILRLGAVVVPMSPLLSRRDVHHRVEDSGLRVLVAGSASRASVEPAARALGVVVWYLEPGGLPDLLGDVSPRDVIESRDADDLAVIVYSAGVTAEPRGAAITHGNLLRSCEIVGNDLLELTSDDVVLSGFALSDSFGQTAGMNATIRAGACLVLLERFSAETALRALRDRGVAVLEGPPTMYEQMLRHPAATDCDVPRLRIGVSGGAPSRWTCCSGSRRRSTA